MSRHPSYKKSLPLPDPVYNNMLVSTLINHIMKKGKKSLAARLCYTSLELIGQETQKNPVSVLELAVNNVKPLVEVKARRRGGATYQVPVSVPDNRGTALAIRWILEACRKRAGKRMIYKLRDEILDAEKNVGNAISKRNAGIRMAEANRAFAPNR